MEIIKLNLIPSGVNPTCHCSQYDNGRVIRIDLFDGLTPYVLQSGDTVTLNVRKPDNTIVTASLTATQGNTYVNLVTTEQICACVGYNLCDLTIANGSTVIGTLNFIMQIERDVLADGIPSQSVIKDLDAIVQEAVGDDYYNKTQTDDKIAALIADNQTENNKTWSSEKISRGLSNLEDFYYLDISPNIVPPIYESGYYGSNGEPVANANYRRTPNAIEIDDVNKYVKLQIPELTQAIGYVCILWYSGPEPTSANYIGSTSIRTDTATYITRTLPNNAKYIQIWVSTAGLPFSDVCVTQSNIDYVPYYRKQRLKYEHINGEVEAKLDGLAKLSKYKILNLGDSIFGNFSAPDDISSFINQLSGATTYNCGFGGCDMAYHGRPTWRQFCMFSIADAINSGDWSAQEEALEVTTPTENVLPDYFADHLATLKSLDFNDIDIITIAYGTNDYQTALISEDNPNDPYDVHTFKGAMRYSIEKINSAYPNCRLVFCTPTYRYWTSGGEFVDDSNTHTQPDGTATLIDYGQYIKDVCKEYNIPCIDNYYIGIGKFTRQTYFSGGDPTHPNADGRLLIAKHICQELF